MKKIINDEDKKYEYVPESKSETLQQDVDISENKTESKNDTYKIVDPKKRMQLYITIIIALVIVIALIVINQTRTRTQTSKVVESISISDTYKETESITGSENSSLSDTSAKDTVSATEKIKTAPVYSVKGNWTSADSNNSLSFDGQGSFTYTWKYSKEHTAVYKGSYIIRIGQGAYETAGLSVDDVSNIFHISKSDFNEANLMYVDCKSTEFSVDGEPFKPIKSSENESETPVFTHLVYMDTDSSDKVIMKYFDELTQSVCTMNNIENQ